MNIKRALRLDKQSYRGFIISVEKRLPFDERMRYNIRIMHFDFEELFSFWGPKWKEVFCLESNDIDAGVALAKKSIDWIKE